MTLTASAPATENTAALLPFFVYGTLRPSEGNYAYILEGNTEREEQATFAGGAMYDAGGFPYVIRGGDKTVTGDVVWVREDVYGRVSDRLDMLEGYRGPGVRNHYDRAVVTVTLADGEQVEANIYLVPEHNARHIAAQCPAIEGGDWLNRPKDTDLDDWIERYLGAKANG